MIISVTFSCLFIEKKVHGFKAFFYSILYPKQFKIILILSGSLLIIGLAGGFYLSFALQKIAVESKIDVFLPAAITFAILTWLGSGSDFLGLLREMYKDYQEERKTPTLIPDKIIPEEDIQEGHGGKHHTTKYYEL
jgi:hypothetical protein